MTVTLRPATADDFTSVAGGPVPFRARAKAAEIDGRVVGVGGVGHLADGSVVAFANLTDEYRKKPIALHKAGLKVLAEARARGVKQILATADPTQPRAPAWLERLGFTPAIVNGEPVRNAEGKPVWVWR